MKRPSKRHILLFSVGIIGTISLLMLVFVTVQFISKRASQNGSIQLPTPTDIVEEAEEKRLYPLRPIILPVGYQLSTEEINLLKSEEVTDIIIEDETEEYKSYIRNMLLTNRLTGISLENFALCKDANLAVSDNSATNTFIVQQSGNNKECLPEHKRGNISILACNEESLFSCSQRLIELSGSLHPESYIYSPQYPFLAVYQQPSLTVNNPFGTYIIEWDKVSYPFTVTSYSVEVLTTNNARVFATGRISTLTRGDYFMPTQEIADQPLITRVRFWVSAAGKSIPNPIVVDKLFAFSQSHLTTQPQNNTSTAPLEMSWIPDWGMTAGITSVRNNPKKWHTISPTWFVLNKDGSLGKRPTINNATLTKLLKDNQIVLLPTIATFDPDIVSSMLNSHMDKHIKEIVDTVVKNNYAGIDLDYESTYLKDKELLITFVEKLAEELHKKGKKLSFTALPKIDDREIYSFLPETHQAQDWRRIGAAVDEFRIMAYDFTGQGSKQPGPLSPIYWNETLIRYAIAQMPAEKVVLALPLYSHGWPKPKTSNLAGANNDQSLHSGELKNTISLQHSNIDYIKRNTRTYTEAYDNWNKEMRAEFTYNGVERVMYYLDKTAVKERLELAKKYGIKGVCYWRIGGESL